MKVLVVGATGGSGRATVEALLADGHRVRAFSRHAGQLDLSSPNLEKWSGDATDEAEVERAVAGQDAVVVTLGVHDNPLKVRLLRRSSTPVDVCSRGTRNVIEAMKKHAVRRLVVESAYGVGDTREHLPRLWKLVYRVLLKEQIEDKELQERLVRESGLDWVIAQPVGLVDKPARGDAFVSPEGAVRHPVVARTAVGRFLARAAEVSDFQGHSVALSG